MEIKKCPCCGGEAQLLKEDLAYRVKCIEYRCNIMTPLCYTIDTAIEIWNNRYIEQPQNEIVGSDKKGILRLLDRLRGYNG